MVLGGTEATTQEQLNKKFIELAQEKEAPARWIPLDEGLGAENLGVAGGSMRTRTGP